MALKTLNWEDKFKNLPLVVLGYNFRIHNYGFALPMARITGCVHLVTNFGSFGFLFESTIIFSSRSNTFLKFSKLFAIHVLSGIPC